MRAKIKKKDDQLTCYGCGKKAHHLPVMGYATKRQFCSYECMHINYFNFETLQTNHREYIENQSKSVLA